MNDSQAALSYGAVQKYRRAMFLILERKYVAEREGFEE